MPSLKLTKTSAAETRQAQNATVVTYDYDHNGMRVRKTVANTSGYVYTTYNYTWHGGQLAHMTKGTDELHFFYDAQGRPAKVDYNGTVYTYVHNLQGDVAGILDTTGTLVVEYKYNAWGAQLSRTGELANTLGYANPFRYRGYIYDDETWMYWLRSRYYYPELHRFISADNVMDGAGLFSANLYAYCKNAPVGASDPSGHTAIGTLEGILSNPSIQEVLRNLTGIFDNAWTAIKMGLVAGATYIATRVIGANAEPRSESQLQEALLAGSATSASVRDHSYATDWYYFAFILSDPENHLDISCILMCH